MRLSREKIQRMIDASGPNTNVRRGGGGGAGGGGGVSSQWVDEHYVSKEFFARLFTINGTDENDDDVVVEPNDLETTITNIQMMVGAWTEQYLSALGLSDGGSGGGGAIALQDLVNVEYVGTPSGGQILKYNDTTGKWYNADDGGGTVQDVTLAMPAGFDVQKTTNQGTIALTVSLDRGEGASALGNKLFLATPVTGDGAPEWRTLAADDLPDLSSTYVKAADIAEYTWWGQTLQTSGHTKIVTGNIKMDNNTGILFKKATGNSYYDVIDYNSNNDLVIGWGVRDDSNTYICGRTLQLAVFYEDTNNNNQLTSRTILYATNGGSVGIGKTNPGYKLDVDGTINCTSIRIGGYVISADSNNSGLHVEDAGLYADTFISALGANSQGGSGVASLYDLTDVQIPATMSQANDGQVLTYSWSDRKWINATPSVSGNYLPLSAGSSYPLTGSLYFSTTGNGVYLKDSGGTAYAGIIDNGTNLWIGATQLSGIHHTGETCISAGSGSLYVARLVSNTRTLYKLLDNGNTYVSSGKGYIDGTEITAIDGYLPLTGGTMTGQIKTSFKEAVATGSYYSEAETIPDLVTDVRYSSGVMGSAYITTDYTLNNITIPTRWYNYLWLPHRTGGVNGGAWGDNTSYGSLLLSGMTASGLYLVRFHNGSIAELRNLYAAEQLQTTRTLWGQNFNGTANVSGDMTDVGSITANGNMTIGTYNGSFVKLIGTSYSFGIHLGGGGTNRGLYDFTSSLDKWLLYFDASNTIMNYGNVGIGTTSPGAKLDVNGQLKATTYLSCHNAVGENGTAGWVCFAIVAVSSAWATQPLKFKVSQRGRLGGEITLRFAGVAAASNTTVQEFSYTGNIRAARVVKNGANFSLYIQKNEEYDDIAISLVNLGTYMSSRVTVTWTNSLSSSDPGGTAATCRYYFSNTAYMEWDETNSAVHFVNAGVYSDTFVSALGANSSGGGGGVNLNTLLTSLNSTSLNPATVSNKVLVNSSGTWTWQDYIAGGGGGGSVTSVGLSMPTGFSITGTNPITESGAFTVTANGTMVPNLNADKLDGYEASGLFETLKNSTASGHTNDIEIKIGNTTKYLTVGYATSAGSATTSGSADTASALSTVSKTLWGNTYWTSGGVPTSVGTSNSIASLSYVGNISMSGSITGCTDIDSILNFDTTNSRVGVGASSPSTRLHVKGRITAEYDSTYSGSFQAIRGNYVTQFGINGSGYALIATGQNGSSSPTVRLSFTPYTETTDPHILTGTSSLKIGTDGTNFYDGKYIQIGAVRMAYNASNTLKVIKADNTTANLEVSGRAIVNSIDLMGENDSGTYYSYLDFHYNGSTADYTTRLIETANAELSIRSNSGSTKTGLVVGRAVDGDYVKIGDIYIGYDSANDALEVYKISGNSHASANLYARGAVSALGQGGSGSGGGIDLNTMWNALENNASGHSIGTSTNGLNALYATSIYANGVQVLTSSNGVTIATDQTISGAKTFSGNLLAKKIQMTASNAATYLEHTKLYSPNATMTIQGSDSAQNLTLCTGGGNVSIGTAADANYRLKVSGSSLFDGNVGIGWYNSSYKLYVSGNAKIQGDFLVKDFKINSYIPSGSSQVCYQIGYQHTSIYTLGSWSSGSDLRRKDILAYSECSLEDVAHAPIFDFAWKGDKSVTPHLGTSAQYWKNVFSNAVSVGPDDYLAMDYGATALAAAVMTARKVVDHEARIKQLEKEIELLKAMKA